MRLGYSIRLSSAARNDRVERDHTIKGVQYGIMPTVMYTYMEGHT
jgi:hypothetical protein